MRALRHIVALLLLAACAGQEAAQEPTHGSAPESDSCGVVLTPDPVLVAETTAAAERWSAATGCDVRVGAGGVAVRLVDVIRDASGKEYPTKLGALQVLGDELIIFVVPARNADVLPHEVGHALNPWAGETHPHGHLAPSDGECEALMCAAGGSSLITAADLEMVCDKLSCSAFAPER